MRKGIDGYSIGGVRARSRLTAAAASLRSSGPVGPESPAAAQDFIATWVGESFANAMELGGVHNMACQETEIDSCAL